MSRQTAFALIVSIAMTFSATTEASAAPDAIDLSRAFSHATRTLSPQAKARYSTRLPETFQSWDGSGGFPPIVNQDPLGSCQSFAMAAWLEYLFYYRTGQVANFSEKALAYQLLRYMIDGFYDAVTDSYPVREIIDGKPNLGNGIAPYMIASVLKSGVVPDESYPTGTLNAITGSVQLDIPLYLDVFEKPVREYSRVEYLEKLDEAFFAAPPSRFNFKFRYFDFASGREKTETVQTPDEMLSLLGLQSERFTVIYNSDLRPFYRDWTQEDIKTINSSFIRLTTAEKIAAETLDSARLRDAIVDSLRKRMVVMIASDVWTGSWTEKLVYKGGGGHAIVIVGFQERDGRTYFKIRNSWGPDAGIDGYNYVEWSTLAPNLLYAMMFRP